MRGRRAHPTVGQILSLKRIGRRGRHAASQRKRERNDERAAFQKAVRHVSTPKVCFRILYAFLGD
jgi:hypothetical protein